MDKSYIKSSKQDLAKFYNLDRPLAKEIQNMCHWTVPISIRQISVGHMA